MTNYMPLSDEALKAIMDAIEDELERRELERLERAAEPETPATTSGGASPCT